MPAAKLHELRASSLDSTPTRTERIDPNPVPTLNELACDRQLPREVAPEREHRLKDPLTALLESAQL
jgi:hypothetical protein